MQRGIITAEQESRGWMKPRASALCCNAVPWLLACSRELQGDGYGCAAMQPLGLAFFRFLFLFFFSIKS